MTSEHVLFIELRRDNNSLESLTAAAYNVQYPSGTCNDDFLWSLRLT